MSTWQIFSDAGKIFRLEICSQIIHTKPEPKPNGALTPPPSSKTQLPSMADLLRQGCPKLLEKGNEDYGNTPIFRTGLGNSVALKQSSISKALAVHGDDDGGSGKLVVLRQSSIMKALSVLGRDDDECPINSGEVHGRKIECGFSNSFFRTGSRKSVDISSAGLLRAKRLRVEEENDSSGFQGFQCPWKSSTVDEQFGWQDLSLSGMKVGMKNNGVIGNDLLSSLVHEKANW